MTTVSSETLDEIVDRLVRGMQPDSIYLFGSQASGQADQGNDIDLLLVLPKSDLPRHRREAQSYDLLWGLTTQGDLIVLTQAEFQRGCRVESSLASGVRAEGKLLYG
jgi:predicted nucleotidyltransferase